MFVTSLSFDDKSNKSKKSKVVLLLSLKRSEVVCRKVSAPSQFAESIVKVFLPTDRPIAQLTKNDGLEQCDQIGQFLKVLGDKFSYKSSPNVC